MECISVTSMSYAVTRICSDSAPSAIFGDLAKGPTISPSAEEFILGGRQVTAPARRGAPIPSQSHRRCCGGGRRTGRTARRWSGRTTDKAATRPTRVVKVSGSVRRCRLTRSLDCGMLQGQARGQSTEKSREEQTQQFSNISPDRTER